MDILSKKLQELTKEEKLVWWHDVIGFHAIFGDWRLHLRLLGNGGEIAEITIWDLKNPEIIGKVQVDRSLRGVIEVKIQERETQKSDKSISDSCCSSNGQHKQSSLEKFLSVLRKI